MSTGVWHSLQRYLPSTPCGSEDSDLVPALPQTLWWPSATRWSCPLQKQHRGGLCCCSMTPKAPSERARRTPRFGAIFPEQALGLSLSAMAVAAPGAPSPGLPGKSSERAAPQPAEQRDAVLTAAFVRLFREQDLACLLEPKYRCVGVRGHAN